MENREALDLAFMTLAYDWKIALELSPDDKVELLKREFGIRVNKDQALSIIYDLSIENIRALLNYRIPELTNYVESQLDDLDIFILELTTIARGVYTDSQQREYILRTLRTAYLSLRDEDWLEYLLYTWYWKFEVYREDQKIKIKELIMGWLPRLKELARK